MTPSDDPKDTPRDLASLLSRAVPSSPIAEEKIQATLRAAKAQAASRRRILGTAGVSGLLLLAAATVWHWSGHSSEAELDFATALSITRGHGSYERGQVQAAAGKVYRDAHKLLALLHERQAVTPAMQQAIATALHGTQPPAITYSTGLESVLAKLRGGQSLNPSDEATALAAACAAATAIRELREREPELTPTANNLLKFLSEELQGPATPSEHDRE